MNNYWHLETWDKEIIKVKPDEKIIKHIQGLLNKGEGMIMTPTRSIAVKSIKDFRLSDEVYTDKKLLEASNNAFGNPALNKFGDIKARWIKKTVPRRRWDSYYRHNPNYRLLDHQDSMVTMAFVLPIHQIYPDNVQELTQDEERRLARV